MFEATAQTRALQDAVQRHDKGYLLAACSDRMIWSMPERDNRRGKDAWVEASCGVSWDWFEVEVLRQVELGEAIVVESWIRQQYTREEQPQEAAGLVVDVWVREGEQWRLVARHPQRASTS